jgi:hypothetical protein
VVQSVQFPIESDKSSSSSGLESTPQFVRLLTSRK